LCNSEFFFETQSVSSQDGTTTEPEHIIPGHDPLVMEKYPPVRRDLAGIAARLDVPPLTQ
jgi:hypothetical protein